MDQEYEIILFFSEMHFLTFFLVASMAWTLAGGSISSPFGYLASGFRSIADYKSATTARLMSFLTGGRAVSATVALKVGDKPQVVVEEPAVVLPDGAEAPLEIPVPPTAAELDEQVNAFKQHFGAGYAALALDQQLHQQGLPADVIPLPLEEYKEFISSGETGGELMRVAVVAPSPPQIQQPNLVQFAAQPWQQLQGQQEAAQAGMADEIAEAEKFGYILLGAQPWQQPQGQQEGAPTGATDGAPQPPPPSYILLGAEPWQQSQRQLEAPPTGFQITPAYNHRNAQQEGATQEGQGAAPAQGHIFPYGEWAFPNSVPAEHQKVPTKSGDFQTAPQEYYRSVAQHYAQNPDSSPSNLFQNVQGQEPPQEQAAYAKPTAEAPRIVLNLPKVVIPGSVFPSVEQSQDSTDGIALQGSEAQFVQHHPDQQPDATQNAEDTPTFRGSDVEFDNSINDGRVRRNVNDSSVSTTVAPVTTTANATITSDDIEEYFRFMKSHDQNQCLARVICMMSSEPEEFGVYGTKINDFFRQVYFSMQFLRPSSEHNWETS